jgi:hypothetical protein
MKESKINYFELIEMITEKHSINMNVRIGVNKLAGHLEIDLGLIGKPKTKQDYKDIVEIYEQHYKELNKIIYKK